MPGGGGQDATEHGSVCLLRCCCFTIAFALGFMKANILEMREDTTYWPQYIALWAFLVFFAMLRLSLLLFNRPALGDSPQEQPASDATRDAPNAEEQNEPGCFSRHFAVAGPAAPLLGLIVEITLGFFLGFAIIYVIDFIQSVLFNGESEARAGFLSSLDFIIGICVIVALWAIFWLLMSAPPGGPR
ncbi:hypothetical protein T484DRAFT_1844654 [Baffinella frigidus]|nr:hypothetical protein T484DRAFT_1844654 [Cryptophyta sp. CCMP2293]